MRTFISGSILLFSIVIVLMVVRFCETTTSSLSSSQPESVVETAAISADVPRDDDDDDDGDGDDNGRIVGGGIRKARSQPQRSPVQIQIRQHFCGQVLVDVLKMLCKGKYNYKRDSSRSANEWYNSQYYHHHNHQQQQQLQQQQNDHHRLMESGPPNGFARFMSWPEFWATLKRTTKTIGNGTGSGRPTTTTTIVTNANKIGRKRKRGIVEECCKSPCTANTLVQYCEAGH